MSDDKKSYAAAQSRHAERIRTERALMDVSGASRSQVRRALREFDQRIERARQSEPVENRFKKDEPEVKVTEVQTPKLRTIRFARENAGGGAAPVSFDGELTETRVLVDLGSGLELKHALIPMTIL